MGPVKTANLPIIPLAKGTVLLPGIILRIPVSGQRTDIPALLSGVYSRAASTTPSQRLDNVHIACIPLNSPFLTQDGQKMITGDERTPRPKERLDIKPSNATKDDLFGYGVAAKISGVEGTTGRSGECIYGRCCHRGSFSHLKQLSRELLTLLRLSSLLPRTSAGLSPVLARRLEVFIAKKDISDAGVLADFMANVVEASLEEKLLVLAALSTKDRLEKAIALLQRQVGTIKNNVRITTVTTSNIPANIDIEQFNKVNGHRNGGSQDDEQEPDEMEELKKKIDSAKMTPEAAKAADRELKRLKKMSPAQAEYQVCRNYLENLVEIPWSEMTEDQLGIDTLSRARKQLDDDHYGLEKVKKRLLEYLAVLKLKQTINDDVNTQLAKAEEENASAKVEILKKKRTIDKSPILLLVGPPGVGKTSLAKSIATALGRKFHRISLGGVRDEAEIRGHRRTYVAAMPGLIVNGLKKVGVANPVFLLDEIDKVGTSNFHGDPSAAMLEVLDPEQNHTFTDHYINIPIDLSKTISLFAQMGSGMDRSSLNQDVVSKIIESYTRESGVRNLEREIGSVCRAKAVEYAEAKDSGQIEKYKSKLSVEDIEEILGIEKFDEEIAEKTSRPGIVTGLVAYSSGGNGSILFIEVADMPGSGSVQLTGKLGDVLKESVEVALSWVKAHAYELGLTHDPSENIMKKRSIHVHCPSGAIQRMAHLPGEISLRGRVTAVGGIKEKLIGPFVRGVKTVLLPAHNRKDIKDVPKKSRMAWRSFTLDTYGKQCDTFGLKHIGRARRISQVLKVVL
ncbi:hypothetical protein DID88_005318 [Monilinia fructigena]|uniref:Lon protease homolog n=1 Tax=Monilinia fructigena TaxID=38457 RepID=A0A395IZF0_9HELO|nr:hypothetical protein DID88_005318 [Monilinia fructigena]